MTTPDRITELESALAAERKEKEAAEKEMDDFAVAIGYGETAWGLSGCHRPTGEQMAEFIKGERKEHGELLDAVMTVAPEYTEQDPEAGEIGMAPIDRLIRMGEEFTILKAELEQARAEIERAWKAARYIEDTAKTRRSDVASEVRRADKAEAECTALRSQSDRLRLLLQQAIGQIRAHDNWCETFEAGLFADNLQADLKDATALAASPAPAPEGPATSTVTGVDWFGHTYGQDAAPEATTVKAGRCECGAVAFHDGPCAAPETKTPEKFCCNWHATGGTGDCSSTPTGIYDEAKTPERCADRIGTTTHGHCALPLGHAGGHLLPADAPAQPKPEARTCGATGEEGRVCTRLPHPQEPRTHADKGLTWTDAPASPPVAQVVDPDEDSQREVHVALGLRSAGPGPVATAIRKVVAQARDAALEEVITAVEEAIDRAKAAGEPMLVGFGEGILVSIRLKSKGTSR